MSWFECAECGRELTKTQAERGWCVKCGAVGVNEIDLPPKLDLNKVTCLQLENIKGIGPLRALYIIEYRKKHPFKQVSELLDVSNVSRKTYDKIKDMFYVK